VFDYLPASEWNRFDRISKIHLNKFEIDYPFEANIWQFPVDEQVEYLVSISNAGCNLGRPKPERFSEWITWKLGEKIARDYMLLYNQKIFSIDLDELSTEWLHKLPDVSIRDTLKSCLLRQPFGNLPAHAAFLYPKHYGYGEICVRLAHTLSSKLRLNTPVTSLDFERRLVNDSYQADVIINTIPWTEMEDYSTIPNSVRSSIRRLKYASMDVTYHPENQDTPAHWTYFPDMSIPYHRILYRHNIMPAGARGYWTETNTKRLIAVQITSRPDNFHNQYAYPLCTLDKSEAIRRILDWAVTRGVIGLGRWGEWGHINSDVAIQNALDLAQRLSHRRT
jgi:protoporphyrinogen oxidase